ncbi:hypothetical protein EC912_103342 [Luteibacter rhizovicinus]|uniref:Uncharacterized protein n=1 Tax=Luteibacter rhizovicinus TaxID=242606 RepID=A0A4R3YUH4_9GAMM|nr:hypothetical protein [Luteibacter rhizovicinus]TCV94853.1 hypothetical protein EC912_103342 [Luteibacter rhizovicinus]
MNGYTRRSAFAAFGSALTAGLQWRLLICWVLITLLPTLVVALPVWHVFDSLLAQSVHADTWAQHFDGLMFRDVMSEAQRGSALNGAFVAGLLLTVFLSPFLTGMVIASGRAGRSLGFGGLMQGGGTEYGRMFRLLLISFVPYGLFGFLAQTALNMGDTHADAALLPSEADLGTNLALGAAILCFVLAQSIVESARAQFMVDLGLRSALRALWRGFMQFLRRPFTTLGLYLAITVMGYALATVIASWRGHTTAAGGGGFVAAFAITQLGVMVVAWMRTARLYALAGVAQPTNARRRRTDFAPAL